MVSFVKNVMQLNKYNEHHMVVDSKAPLTARKEAVINAPIERVWAILSEIDNWPEWQKEVTFAKLDGALEKGTEFKWKAMGMKIASVLQEVVKYKTIGWTGKSMGMNAIHMWKFEKQGEGTKVLTEESLSGWLAKLISLFQPNFLEVSLSKSLQTLKDRAEKAE